MMRRLGAGRLAMAALVLAGVVAVPATPAAAEDDRVGMRVPSSFTVGGSPGAVTVSVTRREDDCVRVRLALGIRLAGLAADQVRVEVAADGAWRPVEVSETGSGIATVPVSPERERLCEKKSAAVRYRVTFLDGAPGGTATLIGQASTADGALLGRRVDTVRVTGAAARPSPTPSRSVEPTVAPSDEPVVVPVAPTSSAKAEAASDSDGLGLGWMVILLGVGMVGVGVALLVLLLRRNRADAGDPATGPEPAVPGGYAGGYPQGGGYPGGYPQGGGYPGGYPQGSGYPDGGDRTRIMPPTGGDQTVIMPRLPHQP